MQLWDSAGDCGGEKVASFELGPAVLRPDGTVFYTGANSCGAGHTAIYKGTWTAGPDFPDSLDIAAGPAALLPSGNVLLDASPGIYNISTFFCEFDGANLNAVPGSPNAPYDTSYYGNMLVLPTGQILISGHYFNGFSQGAAYGDTCNLPRTNPLLRITNNATGHAFYSRTHDHSSMAVAFGGLVSTNFDVPANQETGLSELVVVANGIPSSPLTVTVE